MNKDKNKKGRLLILDGNALIHRSFHALPPTIATKEGEMVNAVFGFSSVLIKAIREFKPDYLVLTLDMKGPTFRHKKFKEYKAQREKAPDDLYKQIPLVKKVASSFNIPIYEKKGYEADDLIGTIVNKVNDDFEKIIITGDMDTLQLINDHTKVYTMSRGISDSVLYGPKEVEDKFDLGVEKLIDFKALRGDPSDNIPGVPGVGEKTATELIKKFGSLDKIYDYLEKKSKQDKIKPRIAKLLEDNKKQAYLSKELSIIKTDVDIDFDLEKSAFRDIDKDKVIEIFKQLEFKSLMSRLNDLGGKSSVFKEMEGDKFDRNKNNFNYQLINSFKDFDKFLSELKKQKFFTFDTETTSTDTIQARLLGISFSWQKGTAYYVNFSDKILSDPDIQEDSDNNLFNYKKEKTKEKKVNYKIHPWLKKLKPIFEDNSVKKRGHNIKFDVRVMSNLGFDVRGVDFDTMIASYLINPSSRQHNLDKVVFGELGFEKISKKDLLGEGKKKIEFRDIELDNLSCYSCEDADFTNRLVKVLEKQLKENKVYELFKKIEMPLVKVLAKMEDSGVNLDCDLLEKLSIEADKVIKKLEKNIYKQAGQEFNINSPKQLKEILFEKLNISTNNISKTKTGYSTAADELEKLRNEHEIIPFLEEYRELSKLLNTYIKALPELINKKTKRLHTNFNQTIAATGRLSSTAPNLQNIPIRTELGRKIRNAFIAPFGSKILSLDYSQIELRLAAHMSGDKKMIEAFKNNIDVHSATASEINRVSLDEVTKNMRREAKAINFGILYGQGPFGLSRTALIPYARAKEFIDKYFEVYNGIKSFIDKQIKKGEEKGYVETLFGRRRYIPEIKSQVPMVKKGAERIAINTPLQGSNADMIKEAMIKIDDLIEKKYKDKVKMIIQVHDELLFEVDSKMAKEASDDFAKIMKEIIKLKVPVLVDAELGDNWGELKKIKTY